MSRFWAQFPFSDAPRRFAAVLGIAAVAVSAGVAVGIWLLPIPRQPREAMPHGALLAMTVPAERPLPAAIEALREQLPQESLALARFAAAYPELAEALAAEGQATLTLFSSSASGTARFHLELPPPSPEEAVLLALDRISPGTRLLRLPDDSRADELIQNPEALRARLEPLPGTDWLTLPTQEDTFAYRSDEHGFVFMDFSPDTIVGKPVSSPSRTACLDGTPMLFPHPLEKRWNFRLLPGFIVPFAVPVMTTTVTIEESAVLLENYCFSTNK